MLLNNWDMQVDAVTLSGKSPSGPHCWLGTVIDGKLYYHCTTQWKLFDAPRFIPNNTEYYPQIYLTSSLSSEDKLKIERHIRTLKK